MLFKLCQSLQIVFVVSIFIYYVHFSHSLLVHWFTSIFLDPSKESYNFLCDTQDWKRFSRTWTWLWSFENSTLVFSSRLISKFGYNQHQPLPTTTTSRWLWTSSFHSVVGRKCSFMCKWKTNKPWTAIQPPFHGKFWKRLDIIVIHKSFGGEGKHISEWNPLVVNSIAAKSLIGDSFFWLPRRVKGRM